MPKKGRQELPDDWLNGTKKTLLLHQDMGISRPGLPTNAKIKKRPNGILYAAYLPAAEDDPRGHGGGARGGKKRRIEREASTKHTDPFLAAPVAAEWILKDIRAQRLAKEEKEELETKTLHAYWEKWFWREHLAREGSAGFSKWRRENNRLWSAEGYGIKHQPFASKSVDEICHADLKDYWALLDARGAVSQQATDMGGTKKDLKTLINHLLEEARDCKDFPLLRMPDFPRISHQRKDRDHFTAREWRALMKKLDDLSGGAATAMLSPSDYAALEFKYKRENQRNWVDLHDALCAMWFWHLRSEDIDRIRTEWFVEGDKENQVLFRPKILKGDRPLKVTENPRPDGYKVWQRIRMRKPSGYIAFPHLERPSTDRKTGLTQGTLRQLFGVLKASVDPPITRKELAPKQVRHTAFRLIVEEDPTYYSTPEGLNELAYQGNTSVRELREKYLEPVRREIQTAKGRARLKPADWSLLTGRVEVD